MTIRVGHYVRRTGPSMGNIIEGQTYQIRGIHPNGDALTFEEDLERYFRASFFELVVSPTWHDIPPPINPVQGDIVRIIGDRARTGVFGQVDLALITDIIDTSGSEPLYQFWYGGEDYWLFRDDLQFPPIVFKELYKPRKHIEFRDFVLMRTLKLEVNNVE